ncbi:hypothetical protein B4100_1404 [Heyndrickxia coagulans]|nr:hypothetical protein B4100_1404 [Heyndrickxia coagulans]
MEIRRRSFHAKACAHAKKERRTTAETRKKGFVKLRQAAQTWQFYFIGIG